MGQRCLQGLEKWRLSPLAKGVTGIQWAERPVLQDTTPLAKASLVPRLRTPSFQEVG